MPISPYSAPIQYEYKPLNLSAFAAPLSEMQQKFDIVTEAVDAADFTLANLPYGTDPERAKELIKIVKSKRDELAKNLGETKNYKQAASKLRELNNLWTKDPELNALQANAKLWAERDKAERERIDKPGGITRDQYLQWKNDEIHKYDKENKGAGFAASAADPTGTYNVITSSTGRLADLDKEFRDLQIEIAKMNPEKASSYFTQNGVSMNEDERVSFQTTMESKNANEIARETEKYLRQIPKFKDWATEVAGYNYREKTKYGENLNEVAKPIVDSTLQNIDAEIASGLKNTKGFKDSKDYKDLMNIKEDLTKMNQTGTYDNNMMQSLYTQQHLNDLYGSQDIGEILAYKNTKVTGSVRKNYEWEAAQKAAEAEKAAGNVSVVPLEEKPWSITSIAKNKIDAGKAIYGFNADINKLVGGNLGGAIMGEKGSKQYKELIKHPDQILAKQELLLTTLTQTLSKGGDWQNFKNAAYKAGIPMSDNRARTLWGSLTKNGNQGIQDFANLVENAQVHATKYNDALMQQDAIKKGAEDTDEFKTFIDDYGNTPVNARGFGLEVPRGEAAAHMSPELEKSIRAYGTIFNKNTYSDAVLKKFGITRGDKNDPYNTLTLNEFARIKGYKDVNDAVNKGYNFENVHFIGGDVEGFLNYTKNIIYGKGLTKEEMGYRFTGNKEVDKTMASYFTSPDDLLTFKPAYSVNWNGQDGFNEDGTLAPGTMINTKVAPKVISHGNKLIYEVPISFMKEGVRTTGSTFLDVKSGTTPANSNLLNILDNASTGDSAKDKQVNDMVRAAKFDVRFPGNSLAPQRIKSIAVDRGNKIGTTVFTIPVDDYSNFEVRKVFPENATGPTIQIFQVEKSTGKVLGVANNPTTGKPWYYAASSNGAASAAKAFIMEGLK